MITTQQFIPKEVVQAADKEALCALLNNFTDAQLRKLLSKIEAGYGGWSEHGSIALIKERLAKNVAAGDWVDVANLAMMLWNLETK